MSKRSAEESGAQAHAKRARLAAVSQGDLDKTAAAAKIEISSVRQLQHALAFHQDAVPEIRGGRGFPR